MVRTQREANKEGRLVEWIVNKMLAELRREREHIEDAIMVLERLARDEVKGLEDLLYVCPRRFP